MKWEVRQPINWRSMPGITESRRLLCATSKQGEYTILGSDGKFAIYLDQVALTGYTFDSAVLAMHGAKKYNKELRDLVS